MKHFWQGFEKQSTAVQFKKHSIVLYWSPEEDANSLKGEVKKLSDMHPSVKVKMVNVKKDPTRPIKHGVKRFPTVLLLKDGREIDRLSEGDGTMMLEHMFRKAAI